MPSVFDQYAEELAQAQREALQALRELLAAETQPNERRRLAIAILRTHPIRDPQQHAAKAPASKTAPHPEPAPPAAPTPASPSTSGHQPPAHREIPPTPPAATEPPLTAPTRKPRREPEGMGSNAAA